MDRWEWGLDAVNAFVDESFPHHIALDKYSVQCLFDMNSFDGDWKTNAQKFDALKIVAPIRFEKSVRRFPLFI